MLCLYSSAETQPKFANSDATIRSIAFDQRGRVWAGSFGRGLWVADEAGITRFFDEKTQQPHPMINNLLFDGRYMWVATAGGGCIRIDTSLDRVIPVEQHAGFSKLHGLTRTSSETLIIGSVGSGSAYFADDRWVPVSESQPVNLAWVNSVIEWQNRLWLGTSTGLYSTGSAISDWQPQYEQLNRGVNHLATDRARLLIATTRNGLYEKKPGKSPEKVSGIDGMIHFILPADRQTLVIGAKAIWLITDVSVSRVANPVANAKCAALDSKNRFFIGTTDGKIYISDNGTNFSLKYFFSDNGLEENKE
jgi:ligand-binding sensor domain-containing protein